MRKYAIGFEVLNKDVSYRGEVLFKHLDNVLTDYNLKDHIVSITGDLRCFGYVMNLATTAFLSSVHFKTTKSKAFSDTLKARKEMSPHLRDTFDLMETMPHIVNPIVGGTRHKNYVGKLFKQFVKDRNDKELNKRIPENLLESTDTRWFSVHRMLERLLYFRPEIMRSLAWFKGQPKKIRKTLSLKTYTNEQWQYLTDIHEILYIFEKAIK